MPGTLLIVESPAKARTIARLLGSGYQVKASVGHVRDLPARTLGVDVENGFRPEYEIAPSKHALLTEIRAAARDAESVLLATDPDREGEAIAWHVLESAHLPPERTRRITFHQITAEAIRRALGEARALDEDLIDAQQARRVLDRLVGYMVSPLLSRALKKPLSAGRVQSVALRLVVERERAIRDFVPVEYWSLEADLQRRTPQQEVFRARLHKIAQADPELRNRGDVDQILEKLQGAEYRVAQVVPGTRRQNPPPPFITSTLQTAASQRLHQSPQQTMRLAQQLYEGIELDGESVGLITYMRTDSTHVAPEAQQQARDYIAEHLSNRYLPDRPPQYRSKVALAQEAHEAIRPTSVYRTPEAMRSRLDPRQARLYELIWQRFVASQMAAAQYATLTVDIVAAQDLLFRANGQRLIFAGFLSVYRNEEDEGQEERSLPDLQAGEIVDLLQLLPDQHFTQPPPRFTEASLVKELEANGVGRPSTYASIISVIQQREYVQKTRGTLAPTELGLIVCDGLVASFADVMDVGYTAAMEARLDQVAAGNLTYRAMLGDFYGPFAQAVADASPLLATAVTNSLQASVSLADEERVCPQCGRQLQVKLGKTGLFLGCESYPECRYTADLENGHPRQTRELFAEGEVCEKCGGRMKIIQHGKSRFLGCENYPTCRNTRPVLSERIRQLAAETACPQCGHLPLEPKSGRYGEYLYCPACESNHSLYKLGVAPRRGQGAGRDDVGATAPPGEGVACPACGATGLERHDGRYGPYYHCAACGKNVAASKMGGPGVQEGLRSRPAGRTARQGRRRRSARRSTQG
ncbi:MAG: type I DNA topoisomerase [Anaerolineae bacterium]|jgi:DNA topoisomerase-1|nr:type I DNA topoisomerase [Chloroflexota bacterium]